MSVTVGPSKGPRQVVVTCDIDRNVERVEDAEDRQLRRRGTPPGTRQIRTLVEEAEDRQLKPIGGRLLTAS
jgi:hypothetical protein